MNEKPSNTQSPSCQSDDKLLSLDVAIAREEACANDTPSGILHRQFANWLKELDALINSTPPSRSTPFYVDKDTASANPSALTPIDNTPALEAENSALKKDVEALRKELSLV